MSVAIGNAVRLFEDFLNWLCVDPAQEGIAAQMRKLKLANVRVINLLGGAMAINCGEKLV